MFLRTSTRKHWKETTVCGHVHWRTVHHNSSSKYKQQQLHLWFPPYPDLSIEWQEKATSSEEFNGWQANQKAECEQRESDNMMKLQRLERETTDKVIKKELLMTSLEFCRRVSGPCPRKRSRSSNNIISFLWCTCLCARQEAISMMEVTTMVTTYFLNHNRRGYTGELILGHFKQRKPSLADSSDSGCYQWWKNQRKKGEDHPGQ